jgi:hypothetical protein
MTAATTITIPQSQTELFTEQQCDKFITVTIAVTKLEAGFFYRWRQLRKQGRCRLLLEFEGETLSITPLTEPEILGHRNGGDNG